jgi:hypothetical protein
MLSLIIFLFTYSQFCVSYCCEEYIKIYKNEMNEEMKDNVIGQAMVALQNQTDMNSVSKNIAKGMDKKYGKIWNCLTGMNSSFDGMNIDSKEKALIWFHSKTEIS